MTTTPARSAGPSPSSVQLGQQDRDRALAAGLDQDGRLALDQVAGGDPLPSPEQGVQLDDAVGHGVPGTRLPGIVRVEGVSMGPVPSGIRPMTVVPAHRRFHWPTGSLTNGVAIGYDRETGGRWPGRLLGRPVGRFGRCLGRLLGRCLGRRTLRGHGRSSRSSWPHPSPLSWPHAFVAAPVLAAAFLVVALRWPRVAAASDALAGGLGGQRGRTLGARLSGRLDGRTAGGGWSGADGLSAPRGRPDPTRRCLRS